MTKIFNPKDIKVRCSSLGNICTYPQSKAAKEAGLLSETAKKEAYKIYIQEVWQTPLREIDTKYTSKGNNTEEDAITLLSLHDNVMYVKNEEKLENAFVKGTPDVFSGESIYKSDYIADTKSRWDAETFLPMVFSEPDKDNVYQLQGYLWLSGAKKGAIANVLVDTPEEQIQDALFYRAKQLGVIALPDHEEEKIRKRMTFDHIPEYQRIHKVEVEYNEEIIEEIKIQVQKIRDYMVFIHNKLTEKHNFVHG